MDKFTKVFHRLWRHWNYLPALEYICRLHRKEGELHFHFTLFTQKFKCMQFKIQMQCIQRSLQQSGRVLQGTKCTNNCPYKEKKLVKINDLLNGFSGFCRYGSFCVKCTSVFHYSVILVNKLVLRCV